MIERLTGVPAVDVWRGPRVESSHAVAACACSVDGTVLYERGTIDVPVFLRSSAKPFIAATVVRSGAVERFGFEPHEIALMAASHNGEPAHVDGVAQMLAKIGATPADLACGPPDDPQARLVHNCSGKHAGILALARMLDAPLGGYLAVAHPAQRAILALCERVFDDRFTPDRIGVDGCGIPVIAVSLRRAAIAFARLAALADLAAADRDALAVVRAAMVAHPWFVAGTGRFDTDLMAAGRGAFVSKSGAEGLQAIALVERGIGAVLKVIDGARRAADPASVDLLDALGALDPSLRAALQEHARVPVTNAAGNVIGFVTVGDRSATSGSGVESKHP